MPVDQFIMLSAYIAIALRSSGLRCESLAICTGVLIYCFLIIGADYSWSYMATGLLNAVVGFVICRKRILAGMCSFLLIPLNFYGYFLAYNYMPLDNYANTSLVILIFQFLFMLPKGLLNGFNLGDSIEYWMVRGINPRSDK